MNSSDLGLTLNISGTLLLAFAFGPLPKGFGGTTSNDLGKVYRFSYLIRPKFFYSGISLIVFGYILQLDLGNRLFEFIIK